MLPGMNYKKYIYLAWILAAANLRFDIVAAVNPYLQKPIFDTELGTFTVFTALTCIALAFFSASLSDNLMRFVETSSRNTLTTFLAAGIFILGFITAVDIAVAFVTQSDMFLLQTVMDFCRNPQPLTDMFMGNTTNHTNLLNNSTIEDTIDV